MAVWYEVEKTENGIRQFMDCNWEFHDFTIERVSHNPERKTFELFLKYDTLEGSILLRFMEVVDFNIVPPYDSYSAVIEGAMLTLNENKLTWLADDSYSPEQIDEIKKYATWIKADQIIWAVADEKGNPTEMPASKRKQIWNVNGDIIEKKFNLKEFQGNPNVIF